MLFSIFNFCVGINFIEFLQRFALNRQQLLSCIEIRCIVVGGAHEGNKF